MTRVTKEKKYVESRVDGGEGVSSIRGDRDGGEDDVLRSHPGTTPAGVTQEGLNEGVVRRIAIRRRQEERESRRNN